MRWRPSAFARTVASLLFAGLSSRGVHAAEVHVAVAANFAAPIKAIASAFERETGHRALISLGATGQLYAQIRQGAPYGLLLSADTSTPQKLIADGLAIENTRTTYAVGRLVLWSRDEMRIDARGDVLRRGDFRRLAIANPKLAPYGAAAIQTLAQLNLLEALRPRIVEGANINQAYQFVASGNAELGFVALSQVIQDGRLRNGSGWIVPRDLHEPIAQDAIVLAQAKDNPAAFALSRYLQSATAREIIRSYGYELP